MNILVEELSNYQNNEFRRLFLEYFNEIGIILPDGYDVFDDIALSAQKEGMRTLIAKANELTIGFIMFQPESFTSSSNFLKQSTLFIREFSVMKSYRNHGVGNILMHSVFELAKKEEIKKIILTTSTAVNYYVKLGFQLDESYTAINKQPVYVKLI